MKSEKQLPLRVKSIVVFALAATLIGSGTATPKTYAAPGDGETKSHNASIAIESGTLSLDIPLINTFGVVKLTSQAQVVNTEFNDVFTVTDSRGTGEGWRLDVSSNQFNEVDPVGGFKPGTSDIILPVGSLALAGVLNITKVGTNPSPMPTSVLTANTVIDDGAVTVSRANTNQGMGEYDISFANDCLSLVVDPATTKVDKINYPGVNTPYEATLTWDLVSAP